MAEVSSKGQQPAKRHKPSRLRNEIRPDSTDDEKGPEKEIVQEPHSDTVVPETQLDRNEHFDEFDQGVHNKSYHGTDDGMNHDDRALIERNAVKKAAGASPPAQVTVKFLSKDALGLGHSSALSSSPSFSFGQARKIPSKTLVEDEAVTSKSATKVSPTGAPIVQAEDQTFDQGGLVLLPAASLSPEAREHLQEKSSYADNPQPKDESPLPVQVIDTSRRESEAGHPGFELPTATSYTPTSAQPDTRSVSGTKKIRSVKKGKKGKKALLSQQRGGPWPPRSKQGIDHSSQAPVALQSFNMFASSPDPSHPEQHGFQVLGAIEEGKRSLPVAVHDYHEDLKGHGGYLAQAVDNDDSQSKMGAVNAARDTPQTITTSQVAVSSQSVLHEPPDQSSVVSFEQLSTVIPEQPSRVILEEPALITAEPAVHVSVEPQSMQLPQKGSPQFRLRGDDELEDIPTLVHRRSQPTTDHNALQKPSAQLKEAETVLHKTSSRGGSHRVDKPHKKTRAASRPLPHRVHGPIMPSGVERSMESLRVALLADQFRIRHDHATTEKHHQEAMAMLRDLVGLQTNTIAEWKGRYQDLKGSVTRLTEKAKTNQKFAAGLQNDYEKMQKSVISLQDQSQKILQEKIDEIENEKACLRQEFDNTLDVLSKSQKNLRATVDDLYVRLIVCDSKKRDLEDGLSRQTAMYEEERKKRDELETQLFSSFENMQRQLGHSSTALIGKLEILQSSINDIPANNGDNAGVEECLVILQTLQSTPFLTAKDVHKAEGMLRFVHQRIESGLGALADVVESKRLPTDELQTFVKIQLHKLRTEILKYEEVLTENRKICESNNTLKDQLEAQRQQSQDLEGRIVAFVQGEADLMAHSTQLESELNDLKATARNHELGSSGLKREMIDLRQQLKKSEDDCKVASTKAEQMDSLRQELRQEVAEYKRQYEGAKTELLSILKLNQEKKNEHVPGLREKITQEFEEKLNEQMRNFKDEIHRLTLERDEKEEKILEQQTQASAAKDQLQGLQRDVKTLESELDATRKENTNIEARLTAMHRTVQESASKASEAANLKERLQQKMEQIQAKTRNHAALECEYADLNNKTTDLQRSCKQLQAEVSQHLSTIEILRKDSVNQISDARQKAQTAVQAAQNQASTVQKENQELSSRLQQARSIEAKWNNAQVSFSMERDTLLQQVTELQAATDAQDANLLRVRDDALEGKRKAENDHRAQIDDWSHRLTQSDAALKTAQAAIRRMEDEHRAKLEFDNKEVDRKIQLIQKSYERKLQDAKTRNGPSQEETSPSSAHGGTPSRSLQDIHAGSNRKKVNRHNQLVLNRVESSGTQHDTNRHTSNGSQPELPRTHREDSEFSLSLFEEGFGNGTGINELLDDYGLCVIDAAAECIPETQDIGRLCMSLKDFDEKMSQTSHHEPERQDSTDLTTISSGELAQMETGVQRVSTPMLRGHDHKPSKDAPSQKDASETPIRSDEVSASRSRSSRSHDRPRSQANTGSRMMPPPEFVSHNINHRIQVHDRATRTDTRHPIYEKSGHKLSSSSGTSSPDFMHPPSSASKNTYGDHDPRFIARNEHSQLTPQGLEQDYLHKRKSPVSQTEQDMALKKQRTLPRSYLPNAPSESRIHTLRSSKSPVVSSRPKAPPGSSNPQASSSAASRSKTQSSSSSVPPRGSGQIPSSSGIDQSRGHQLSSSQAPTAGPTRRTSSRLTRSKTGRGVNGAYEDRFGQELSGR